MCPHTANASGDAPLLLYMCPHTAAAAGAGVAAPADQMSCVSPMPHLEPQAIKCLVSLRLYDDRMMAGTASNLAAAERLALQSGVTEGQWERMHDEMRRHWVSLWVSRGAAPRQRSGPRLQLRRQPSAPRLGPSEEEAAAVRNIQYIIYNT